MLLSTEERSFGRQRSDAGVDTGASFWARRSDGSADSLRSDAKADSFSRHANGCRLSGDGAQETWLMDGWSAKGVVRETGKGREGKEGEGSWAEVRGRL